MFVPKIVLVTMFEPPGEKIGELALFQEGLDLEEIELAECGPIKTFAHVEMGVLAVVAGVGTANTAISIMALGMADALDVSSSFWVICGIAGGNPYRCSLGSVVMARWCVDGDLALEFDTRDRPTAWDTGILPLGAQEPFGIATTAEGLFGRPYQVFQLNGELVQSLFATVCDLNLQDDAEMQAYRAAYTAHPFAQQPPKVLQGDTLSAARFWHGEHANQWAERWVEYWTQGAACFTTSSMEDTGTLHAIEYLDSIGRANFQQVLSLRSVSNYTFPPKGVSAIDNIAGEAGSDIYCPGYLPALENLYRVARSLISALIDQN